VRYSKKGVEGRRRECNNYRDGEETRTRQSAGMMKKRRETPVNINKPGNECREVDLLKTRECEKKYDQQT
jgi:hypothetical protein